MRTNIIVENNYLWVPIWANGEKQFLTFTVDGEKQMEFHVPVKEEVEHDFYASIPVEHLKGKTVELSGLNDTYYKKIRQEKSGYFKEGFTRPAIHFTANTGWINDPNGLVYDKNGTYHLYFQFNPFDVEWDNMSWGHATSKDLLHWTWEDAVIWPDEDGMMFSGCGLRNEKELLGEKKDALIYYYSAAGDATPWSKGKMFTQRLAISTDGGRRFKKIKDVFVPTIERENRDPKVFWHEKSNAYIMVLWLQEDEFAILRSTDLKNFTISQRLRLKDAFECPDLFELRIENTDETKWVFWCADGFYYLGDFDGYTFTLESDKLISYASKLPYAAQTISGLSNRVVSIPWLRALFKGRLYTGAMGIPREFSLVKTEDRFYLKHSLCKEYVSARILKDTICSRDIHNKKENQSYLEVDTLGKAIELEVSWNGECSDCFELILGEESIVIDYKNKTVTKSGEEPKQMLPHQLGESFSIIIDDSILEMTAQDSTLYIAEELKESANKIRLSFIPSEKEYHINIYEVEMRN